MVFEGFSLGFPFSPGFPLVGCVFLVSIRLFGDVWRRFLMVLIAPLVFLAFWLVGWLVGWWFFCE